MDLLFRSWSWGSSPDASPEAGRVQRPWERAICFTLSPGFPCHLQSPRARAVGDPLAGLPLSFLLPPLQGKQVPPKRTWVAVISRLMGLLLVDSNILLVNILQVSIGSEDILFLLFLGLSQIGPPLHVRKRGHWEK